MNSFGILFLILGTPTFALGSYWMFSGKPIFRKEVEENLVEQGVFYLLAGAALLFTGIGFL